MALLMGIDVGGTNLRIGIFDGLKLVDESRFQADFASICQKHSPMRKLPRLALVFRVLLTQ